MGWDHSMIRLMNSICHSRTPILCLYSQVNITLNFSSSSQLIQHKQSTTAVSWSSSSLQPSWRSLLNIGLPMIPRLNSIATQKVWHQLVQDYTTGRRWIKCNSKGKDFGTHKTLEYRLGGASSLVNTSNVGRLWMRNICNASCSQS